MSSSFSRVRLDDGSEVVISEWMQQPLYSVIELANVDGINLNAFNYTVGGRVTASASVTPRDATEADTNIPKKRAMTQDQALILFSITYEIWGTDSLTGGSPGKLLSGGGTTYAPDLRALQRDCLVELYTGGLKKPVYESPFSYVGQSIGVPIFTSGDNGGLATLALNVATGGWPRAQNQRKLELPIYIGGFGENAVPGNSMPFYLRFWSPLGPVSGLLGDYRMRWHLDGIKRRPG